MKTCQELNPESLTWAVSTQTTNGYWATTISDLNCLSVLWSPVIVGPLPASTILDIYCTITGVFTVLSHTSKHVFVDNWDIKTRLCDWQCMRNSSRGGPTQSRALLVSSPDLIRRVYRLQYNAWYWKWSTLGLVLGLGPRLVRYALMNTPRTKNHQYNNPKHCVAKIVMGLGGFRNAESFSTVRSNIACLCDL